jgi:hypothetical protein
MAQIDDRPTQRRTGMGEVRRGLFNVTAGWRRHEVVLSAEE